MNKRLVFLLLLLFPLNLFAFKVTVYDLSEDDTYFNAKDIEENKSITIRWTSSVTNATYYINIDSSSKSTEHQVASGSYNGGDASYTLYASDILSHANNTLDGDKEIYVLIEARESDDAGSSTPKFQDNIKALIVHFDRIPPPAPLINSIVPGENSLQVYLEWGQNSSESDKYGFNVYYRKTGSNEEPQVDRGVKTTRHKITGLVNNVSYDVWAEQIDKAKNVSEKSAVVTGTPREVLDYYEYYKGSGGKEEGGFCFITTAVYGSPVHPIVYIYKGFRDNILSRTSIGERFISVYYRYSPYAADFIRDKPLLRALSALFLTPLALVLLLIMRPIYLLLICGIILSVVILLRHLLKSPSFFVLFTILFIPVLLYAESDRSFGVSLNIGDYRPSKIDSEKGLTSEPYRVIFDNKSELMFKLGLDYEPFQRLGTLSIGGVAGFWQVVGKGVYNYGSNSITKSQDTTVFNIIPFELNMMYKFDYCASTLNIPLVPYGKIGLDYYVYWITDAKGDVSSYKGGDGKSYDGYGGKTGYHYAGGLMFLLDWIDQETAADFDMEFGVNNSYLFVEIYKSIIDGFGGEGFNLSSSGFFFGLYLDI